MTLVDDQLEDLADLTLIDENTKLILTDDANKEIPTQAIWQCMWRHPVAKFLTNASGAKKGAQWSQFQ